MLPHERIIEIKVYKHRRRRKKARSGEKTLRFYYPSKLKKCFTSLIKVLNDNGFIKKEDVVKEIVVPEYLSFRKDFERCITFFRQMISTFVYRDYGNVKVDFSQCKYISISTFMVFDLISKELRSVTERYNTGFSEQLCCNRKVKVTHPSAIDEKVNKYLISFGYYSFRNVSNVNGDDEAMTLGLIKGKWRDYYENMKSLVAKRIAHFVNESLKKLDWEINARGQNAIEVFVAEILDNAEEHSSDLKEWYVNGISFNEVQGDYEVVEMNLSIINFGKTMYEGFEETKWENLKNYSYVDQAFQAQSSLPRGKDFTREALFMMYMLNEGVSRLKYQDDARGNGTMSFLENFIFLGSFGLKVKEFNPILNIISGSTVLTCDGYTRPYKSEDNGTKIISLNKSQSLQELPDSEYLRSYEEKFPGTILECKIYFNKEFFDKEKSNNRQ